MWTWAREYDPTTERFTTPDSAALSPTDVAELDRYVYAAANPINASDPSGHNFLEYALQAAVSIGGAYFAAVDLGESLALLFTEGAIDEAAAAAGAEADIAWVATVLRAVWDIYHLVTDLSTFIHVLQQVYQAFVSAFASGLVLGGGGEGGGIIGGGGGGTGIPRYLYHYTEAANVGSIFAYGLRASIPQPGNPNNAAFGPGQYFTDLTPDEASTGTMFQVAAALFKFPFFWGGKRRIDIVAIKIDVSGLPIIRVHSLWTRTFGDRSIFLNPTVNTLSLKGRAGAGSVTFIDFK